MWVAEGVGVGVDAASEEGAVTRRPGPFHPWLGDDVRGTLRLFEQSGMLVLPAALCGSTELGATMARVLRETGLCRQTAYASLGSLIRMGVVRVTLVEGRLRDLRSYSLTEEGREVGSLFKRAAMMVSHAGGHSNDWPHIGLGVSENALHLPPSRFRRPLIPIT